MTTLLHHGHLDAMSNVPSSPLFHKRKSRWARWPVQFLCLLVLLILSSIGVLAFGDLDLDTPWHLTSQERTGQAPDPAIERRAMVQVYGGPHRALARCLRHLSLDRNQTSRRRPLHHPSHRRLAGPPGMRCFGYYQS